nr:hypothetical protein [Bacillus velezensis]
MNAQFRQLISAVDVSQFLQHDGNRHPVRNQVMHIKQQHMAIVIERLQADSEQRRLR